MRRFGLGGLGLAGALLLGGCASFGVADAPAPRSLDYLTDDMASLVLAFDMPQSLEPQAEGSELGFDITALSGESRQIRATLVRSDAGEIAGTLPPPAGERTYYLFGFSEADKALVREAQAWARALPPGAIRPEGLAVGMTPRFCATRPVDPANVRVAVLLALPGAPGLRPLVPMQVLATAPGWPKGQAVPPCAGHSG